MNLVQLQYAKIVAQTGSFSAAARACRVSQPTISNAISELESEWGAKLFKRSTRRVELSAFGRAILRHIEGMLNSAEELEQEVKVLVNPRHKLLRVAFSPVIDSRRLMAMFEPFKQGRPDLEIHYKECNAGDLETRLDNEQVDVICGIRLRVSASRKRHVLYRDVLRYLPRGGLQNHASPQSVALKDLARETLILTVGACGLAPLTRELFQRSKINLREYPGQAISYQVLQEWTEHGIGAALLPESRIVGNAKAYPLLAANRKPVIITYEAVWDRQATAALHVKEFFKYLKNVNGEQNQAVA